MEAQKIIQNDKWIVKLVGELDENVELEGVLGLSLNSSAFPAELDIYCKSLRRINSAGVTQWMRFFPKLTEKGVRLAFFECSIPFVMQLNVIHNFTCGGTVHSICAPYICQTCQKEMIAVVPVANVLWHSFKLPEQKCSCGGPAEFDELPDEYFGFLTRKARR